MPLYGFVGGGKTTFDAGAVMSGDLSPQKARLLLMLKLHQRRHRQGRPASGVRPLKPASPR
jgi:L-asparaginase/Glu-tRNA(Gln) amidotransferase subunit D